MKFVDLKCPNCGGRLIPVEGNQKIVACEYCGSQYILEDDRVINYHIYQQAPPKNDGFKGKNMSSDQEGVLAVVVILLGLAAVFGVGIALSANRKSNFDHSRYAVSASTVSGILEEEKEEVLSSHSPFYDVLLEGIYGRPAHLVDSRQKGRLKYLRIETGRDSFSIDYSFGNLYEDPSAEIGHLELKPEDWDTDDLAEFPELVKLELGYRWTDGKVLDKLSCLQGLSCREVSPKDLAEWLEPGQLRELNLDKPTDLEGLSAFENLEILSLEDVVAPDIRQLVSMKQLKSLTIIEDEPDLDESSSGTLTDYSALTVLTGLQELNLESASVRDVGFLNSLTGLTKLSLAGTEAISLESLGELSGLTSLCVTNNDSVKGYEFIPKLTGLKSLVLDKDDSCSDPDLSSLSQLEELNICGFQSMAPLKGLKNLKSLSIHGCNVDEINVLSSLSGLERLTCYSMWAVHKPLRNLNFVDGMTSLKYLDLSGIEDKSWWGGYGRNIEIYGDISNVFNHAGLEELYLNQCLFGIDFDQLRDNPSLKKLQMKEVSLKKNFYVESYSGVTNIWYDDVSLAENIDFLNHYSELEELYLDGNQLTSIQFASKLNRLERLGINNNYVTDLTPLNQAARLKYLDIRQNPVNNTIEAGDLVEVIK